MVMRGRGATIADFAARHPAAVEAHPDVWFPIAVERWFDNDVQAAVHWMDRSLASRRDGRGHRPARIACMRLMRARLGPGADVRRGRACPPRGADRPPRHERHARAAAPAHRARRSPRTGSATSPRPRSTSRRPIGLCRTRSLPRARDLRDDPPGVHPVHAGPRARLRRGRDRGARAARRRPHLAPVLRAHRAAGLALQLGDLVRPAVADRRAAVDRDGVASRCTRPTSCTRFWLRMRDARLALMAGRSQRVRAGARDAHATCPPLPDHLRVVVLLERAFLASLSGDLTAAASPCPTSWPAWVRCGEAALVHGLRDDLVGDRRSAAAQFADGGRRRDVLAAGDPGAGADLRGPAARRARRPGDALDRLREAALVTEVRRNAVPFLGWSRQGTPMETLLARLDEVAPTPWVHELAEARAGHPDIASAFAPTTATPRERLSSLRAGRPADAEPPRARGAQRAGPRVDVRRHRGEPVRLREHDQDARVEPLREARRSAGAARRSPWPATST